MMVLILTYKSQRTEMFGPWDSLSNVRNRARAPDATSPLLANHMVFCLFVQIRCNINSKKGKHWVLLFALSSVVLCS